MIGQLVLYAKENTSSSKSILHYTFTSTAYLVINRTECALLVLLLRTCVQTKPGHAPYFLTQKGLLLINKKKLYLPLLCYLQKVCLVS